MGSTVRVYIGTYTNRITFGDGTTILPRGKGIYRRDFNCVTGESGPLEVTGDVENPSFLALGSNRGILYAVNETKSYQKKDTGAVSAFAVDRNSGELTLLNRLPTEGCDPCHALVGDNGMLYISNFSSGSLSVFALRKDGGLGHMVQMVQNKGGGPHPVRQEGPHIHSTVSSPDQRHLLAIDLGNDQITTFALSDDRGNDFLHRIRQYIGSPGDGPRIGAFNRAGTRLYVVNELKSTVSVLRFDSEEGALSHLQTISTLQGQAGENLAADIRLTRDEKYLYVSNRGLNNIACFSVDAPSGTLEPIGSVPSGGKTPRCMALDSGGRYLLCANQDDDCVCVFRMDSGTGKPEQIDRWPIPNPACVIFAE